MSGFQRFAGGTLMSLTLLYSEVFHLILESVHSYNQWHVNQTWQWKVKSFFYVEMFYLNTIEQLLIFVEHLDQLEVCLPYSSLLTGIAIQAVFQNLRWNSNKTTLLQKTWNLSKDFEVITRPPNLRLYGFKEKPFLENFLPLSVLTMVVIMA